MARVPGDAQRPTRGVSTAALTARASVGVLVMVPAVPVIVTEDVAVARVLLAFPVRRSSDLVGVVGFVLNDAVTPFGRPDAAKVTFPVKAFWGATVMVLEPLDP